MPIDPTSATEALLEYGALGLFIAFLLFREWQNAADKKEMRQEHDQQKSNLIVLLKESQDARIAEIKDNSAQFHDGMRMMHNVVETLKASKS